MKVSRAVLKTLEKLKLFVEHLSHLHSLVLHAPGSQATPQRGFPEASSQMAGGIATFPCPLPALLCFIPLNPS